MKAGTFLAELSSTDFTVAPKRTGGVTIAPWTMPDCDTSIPYLAVPLLLEGLASPGAVARSTEFP